MQSVSVANSVSQRVLVVPTMHYWHGPTPARP